MQDENQENDQGIGMDQGLTPESDQNDSPEQPQEGSQPEQPPTHPEPEIKKPELQDGSTAFKGNAGPEKK